MSIYAIGDIHGQYEMLIKLIKKINIKKNDQLVFLGDYIDRGPDSFEVIQFLVELSKKHNCIFIKGNHEDMFLKYLDNKEFGDRDLFLLNRGNITLQSFKNNGYYLNKFEDLPKEFQTFFRKMNHMFISSDNFLFVHAGIDPKKPIENQTEYDMIWDRDFHNRYAEIWDGPYKVIFGHTPMYDVRIWKKAICIDTGATFNHGYLTAIKLPYNLTDTKNIIQIKHKR